METLGIEVRRSAELVDAIGDFLHVFAFVARVLDEFFFDAFAIDADGRDGVHRVPKNANDFGRERGLQQIDGLLHFAFVILRYRTAFDLFLRAATKFGDIGYEWLLDGRHSFHSLHRDYGGQPCFIHASNVSHMSLDHLRFSEGGGIAPELTVEKMPAACVATLSRELKSIPAGFM